MSSSDRNNNNNNNNSTGTGTDTETDDGYAYDFTALAAFTSGDAHNGCRALFNGTAGWAFFGPAGFIDPKALPPGTQSYPCDFKGKGKPSARTSPPRPGEGLGRKTNDARCAYLDAEDLRHLVRGTSEAEADGDAEGGEGEGAEGGGGAVAPRKGRPIVLTLQAILAATSPASPAAAEADTATAAAIEAAAAAGARVKGYSDGDDDDDNGNTRRPPESVGPAQPVTIADRAQFPPLLLRGASADKGPGLFLAPPITMVKNSAVPPAGQPDTRAAAAGGVRNGGTDGDGGGVSCSEAVAATSVAEAAADVRDGGGGGGDGAAGDEAGAAPGGGGMSRIGWWLRWATTTSGADSAAAAASEQRGGGHRATAGGGGGPVSLETSNGADGWQVISAPAPGAPAAASATAAAEVPPSPVCKSEDGYDDGGSWCDFAAEEEEEEANAGETSSSPVPLAVRDGGGGGGAGSSRAGVAIEDALKRAAGGTIYDDAGSSLAGDEEPSFEGENSAVLTAGNDRNGDGDHGVPPHAVSPNVPLSFRDTLMAPSATGAVRFSDSRALLRARAAAGSTGRSAGSPTLVAGGADGGAVFLWRKAAAGEAGRPDLSKEPVEDEDPYYARKRVGAFAFRTKPRGKAHK